MNVSKEISRIKMCTRRFSIRFQDLKILLLLISFFNDLRIVDNETDHWSWVMLWLYACMIENYDYKNPSLLYSMGIHFSLNHRGNWFLIPALMYRFTNISVFQSVFSWTNNCPQARLFGVVWLVTQTVRKM